MKPLVSIILLTYNQEDSIGRAFDSLLMQRTSVPFEIVVGEDASTDATRRICEEYARRNPQIIRLMPAGQNKGVVRNFFDCLGECRGKYISDCAGDDCWLDENRLECQVRQLEDDERVSAVCCDVEWDNTYTGQKQIVKAERVTKIHELYRSPMQICLSAMLYRADVVRRAVATKSDVVGNTEFGLEDLPIMAELVANGSVERTPIVGLRYSIHDGSISNSSNHNKMFDFAAGVAHCSIVVAQHYGVDCERIRVEMNRKIGYMISLALHCDDRWRRHRAIAVARLWRYRLPWKTRMKLMLLEIKKG